jgi:hypothetical protein
VLRSLGVVLQYNHFPAASACTYANAGVLASGYERPARHSRQRCLADERLVAYWKFDDASGTSVADSKGSNTGTWNGSWVTHLESGQLRIDVIELIELARYWTLTLRNWCES